MTGTPLLLTAHVGAPSHLGEPQRSVVASYERSLGRFLIATATRLICVSEDVRGHLLALGARPSKLRVIPNGVDATAFAPAPSGRAWEPPFRLITNKGPRLALEAAALLRTRATRSSCSSSGPARWSASCASARRGSG